jgi:hypothetical protein
MIYANQPGVEPFHAPEQIPNPLFVPQELPAPLSPKREKIPVREPVNVPEKVNLVPRSRGAFSFVINYFTGR